MPDVIIYSAVISACEKAQAPKRASQVLNGMQHYGIMPNIITYNVLFSACEKGTLPSGALQLVEAMLHQGICQTLSPTTRWLAPVRRARCRNESCSSEVSFRTCSPTVRPSAHAIRAKRPQPSMHRLHGLQLRGLLPDVAWSPTARPSAHAKGA